MVIGGWEGGKGGVVPRGREEGKGLTYKGGEHEKTL